jgi:hypothetical protein
LVFGPSVAIPPSLLLVEESVLAAVEVVGD